MFDEEAARFEEFRKRLDELRSYLNTEDAKVQIERMEHRMSQPDFWDNAEAAQENVQRLKTFKTRVTAPDELKREIEDAEVLVQLAEEEGDPSMGTELAELAERLEEKLRALEISSLLSGPRDDKNVILSIHPGAGGTESCDWAGMLYRMLTRWCERHEYGVEVVDYQEGEEAGLKSATLRVTGPLAYGHLRSESGVHRLVRISPFDASSRRHTSFAAVEVLTEVDQDVEVDLREEDIKMDVYRSSGAGGQKVNKTSSAVRLTHQPTGIVVASQIERSQHRNRAVAMEFLRAKLYDIEMRKKEAEVAAQREGQQDVAWGSQIRSYVLQPYQMVKDHRTNVETSNVDRVLDGEIDLFIEGYLKWDLERKGRA